MHRLTHYQLTSFKKSLCTHPLTKRSAPTRRRWEPVGFGDYDTLTMPELALTDMEYFFWVCNCPSLDEKLQRDADLVRALTTRIKRPGDLGPDWRFVMTESNQRVDRIVLMREADMRKKSRGVVWESDLLDCQVLMDRYPQTRWDTAMHLEHFIWKLYFAELQEAPSKKKCLEYFENRGNFG